MGYGESSQLRQVCCLLPKLTAPEHNGANYPGCYCLAAAHVAGEMRRSHLAQALLVLLCRCSGGVATGASAGAHAPPQGNFASGATKTLSWDCGWETDESGVHLKALGLAGAAPRSSHPKAGPHASAEACEKFCCEAAHLRLGPEVDGGRRADAVPHGTEPRCDAWQVWPADPAAACGGCPPYLSKTAS
jgi:hypothetical protein